MSEAIDVLKSIDASLKRLVAMHTKNAASSAIASDRDLDSQYGNPKVKSNPRDWSGPSCVGRTFSQCPAEFLDLLADRFDYFAEKDEAEGAEFNGKPSAPYKRKDAARARGWAKRVREGKVTPIDQSSSDFGGGSDDFGGSTSEF